MELHRLAGRHTLSLVFQPESDHGQLVGGALSGMYNQKLVEKPQIIVLNKLDLPGTQKVAEKFQFTVKDKEVILISALTGKGVEKLKSKIVQLLDNPDEL